MKNGVEDFERETRRELVAYDPDRHQDTIPRRRRSPFARADLSAYLYFFISLLWTFWPARV